MIGKVVAHYMCFDKKYKRAFLRILDAYPQAITRHGCIWFSRGTEEERRFLLRLGNLRQYVTMGIIRVIVEKELTQFRFFRLCTESIRGLDYYSTEISTDDTKRECSECSPGWKQDSALVFPFSTAMSLDIFTIVDSRLGPIYVISSRLKQEIEDCGATGCRFTPCIDKPSSQHKIVKNEPSHYSNRSSDFYQLHITETTKGPYRCGEMRILDKCRKCGRVHILVPNGAAWFLEMELSSYDFQVYNKFASPMAEHTLLYSMPLISSRILNRIISGGKSGIIRCMSEPPIKYAVVETDKTITDLTGDSATF